MQNTLSTILLGYSYFIFSLSFKHQFLIADFEKNNSFLILNLLQMQCNANAFQIYTNTGANVKTGQRSLKKKNVF